MSSPQLHSGSMLAFRARCQTVVLVLNKRFMPETSGAKYIYGVVQHVMHILTLLECCGVATRFLLYKRDDDLSHPSIKVNSMLGRVAATVEFNFKMQSSYIKQAFANALEQITRLDNEIFLYSQSAAVSDLLPEKTPMIMTNHSPFVASVFRELGTVVGKRAFDWDHPKADFLRHRQEEALNSLIRRQNVSFAEISRIQIDYLRVLKLNEGRLFAMPPPVGGRPVPAPELLPPELRRLSKNSADRYALFPVSRFDYFKDLDLFVKGAARAIEQGVVRAAIVIGSDYGDDTIITAMKDLETPIQERFIHLPRQRREVLTRSIFPWIADCGVVACTSRYDLVPYTVLEAILAGAAVVVPESRLVGVSEYVPSNWRYARDPKSLSDALSLGFDKNERELVRNEVETLTSDNKVLEVLSAAMDAADG